MRIRYAADPDAERKGQAAEQIRKAFAPAPLGPILEDALKQLETSEAALADWESTMRPWITQFQKSAEIGIGVFKPSSDKAIRIRKRAMSLMTHPVVSWLFSRVGKFLPAIQQRERPIA